MSGSEMVKTVSGLSRNLVMATFRCVEGDGLADKQMTLVRLVTPASRNAASKSASHQWVEIRNMYCVYLTGRQRHSHHVGPE